jgi:hypothetical protein
MSGRRALACVPIVAVLWLAACGDAEQPASTPDPDQPVQSTDVAPKASPRPAKRCKRVARGVVGRKLPAARAMAQKARCPLRVVIEDGRSLPVTEDFSPDRINVRVERGVVADVLGLY